MSIVLNSKAVEIAAKARGNTSPRLVSKAQGDVGEVFLYAPIGDYFPGGVGASEVIGALDKCKNCKSLDIYIASEGGDVFQGKLMAAAIKRMPMKKTMYTDSICASIATVIAMAGDEVITSPDCTWMIHEAFSMAGGNAGDLRKTAEQLDIENANIAAAYVEKTGMKMEEVVAMMAAETWFSGVDAAKMGFANKCKEPMKNSTESRPVMKVASPIELMRMRSKKG
jgi:ATP-dependent protease ClpP protease subunit